MTRLEHMCVEPGCPVMIHGGTVARCVEHAYARLEQAEALLRECGERLYGGRYIARVDLAEKVRAFLATPEPCGACGGRKTLRRYAGTAGYFDEPCPSCRPIQAPTCAEPTYPCDDCGKLRTKAQGGTVFTVCDDCWDKRRPRHTKDAK